MSREAILSVGLNTEIASANGVTAKIISFERVRKKATGTPRHETNHAVINPGNVRRVTIRPGPGYLGLTELYKFDPVAAAAPKQAGDNGTNWDEELIDRHGHDVGTAMGVAGSVLADLEDEVDEVAGQLTEKGEMSGFEVKDAMKNAGRRRVRVEMKDDLGNITYIDTETRKNQGYMVTIGLETDVNNNQFENNISPFSSRVRKPNPIRNFQQYQRARVISKAA